MDTPKRFRPLIQLSILTLCVINLLVLLNLRKQLPMDVVPTTTPQPTPPNPVTAEPPSLDSLSPVWPTEIQRWESLILPPANQYQIDPNLVAAVMVVESGGQPNVVSRSGARGLLQIVPLHGDCSTFDPQKNIQCGIHLLVHYYEVGNKDWRTGLAMYNCGPTGVRQNRCGANGGYAYADKVLTLWYNSVQ